MTAKSLAILFGLIFIALGLLGFVSNPIIGTADNVIFHADQTNNIVHIASGALLILVALAAPGAAGTFLILFGLVYLALGIMGLVQFGNTDGTGTLLGFLHVNGPDNYLYIALGAIFLLTGATSRRVVRTSTDRT